MPSSRQSIRLQEWVVNMRLLFVADGRSAITINWISYFVEHGHQVHLVSSYPAEPELELASLHVLPLAFGGAAASDGSGGGSWLKKLTTAGMRTKVRQWLGPADPAAGRRAAGAHHPAG